MTKSSISFGLVHIPVSLKPSIKTGDIGFNMIDRQTKSRIQYQKTCVDCDGRIVAQQDIIKGYQYEKGEYVFFDDDDFEKLKTKKDKTIAIEQFVSLTEIDPIYYEKAYYVTPEKAAGKAFTLLFAVMKRQNKVGIARTVIGTKEHLVTLRVHGAGLLLSTMYFDDEVQEAPSHPTEKPDSKEIELAANIIDNMTGKFNPKGYTDRYNKKIMDAVKLKIAGKEVTPIKESKPVNVINLMDALKKTLATSKKAASQ